MRIFLLLLLSLPLLAKTILYGDIDYDGKNESMELRSIGANDMGGFYQLIVKDDNGKILWKARASLDESSPYSFFEAHHGISMPEILVDIDDDGYMELVAPLPQSDVSPTYYRKLKWLGSRFDVMPSNALMMDNANRFSWKSTKAYQGTWVSGFVSVKNTLIKANVTSAIGDSYKSGTALLRFDSKGADVVKWIRPLKSGYNNHEKAPKEEKPTSSNTKSNQIELNLKLIVNYSHKAKAKLKNNGEKLIASLMLNEYGAKYMSIEGVALKDTKFTPKHTITIKHLKMQKKYKYNPNKNYKLNINIYSAREVFRNNIVSCMGITGDIEFDLKSIQNGSIEFECKLIEE